MSSTKFYLNYIFQKKNLAYKKLLMTNQIIWKSFGIIEKYIINISQDFKQIKRLRLHIDVWCKRTK